MQCLFRAVLKCLKFALIHFERQGVSSNVFDTFQKLPKTLSSKKQDL